MKRKLTLKLIAKELGVSISTVSKALRDSPEISEETREKIKAYAKLYNYKPNNIALSLKNRRTNTIGVIIPQIVHHFFTTVISGIEQEARDRNYNVIICLSNNGFDKEVENMELLANGSTDGFILSISKETMLKEDYHHLNEVIEQGMPVVMFDRVVEGISCDRVLIDDKAGAKKGVSHMIRTGCRKIGIITSEDYISVGRLRTEGYLDALDDYGIAANDNLILKLDNIDDLTEESKRRIEEFVTKNDLDGIFTVNEFFAVHATRVLTKLGKKIPEDVSIVCFTDGQLSENMIPSLTAVSQHGEEMGRKAASILIEKLEREDSETAPYDTAYIDTSLVERESTRKLNR